jgi:subtilisin-like proprotein convertase family protein
MALRNSGRTGVEFSQQSPGSATAAAAPLVTKLSKRGRSRGDLARSLRSLFEALEDRTLFSTLPMPTTAYQGVLAATGSSPQVAQDPANPQKLFAAYSIGTKIAYQYSTNAGATWSAATQIPNTTRTAADSPSVAIDRAENVYVVYTQSSGGSGDVELQKYSFTTTKPVLDATVQNESLYTWKGGFAAATPTVAVDANPAAVNGFQDLASGNIYVAWSQAQGSSAAAGSHIQYTLSTNGGATFPGAVDLNNNILDQVTGGATVLIPDNTGTAGISTLAVPLVNRTIQNVDVTISVTHPNLAELSVSLVSARGTVVPLVLTGSASGADFTNTKFSSANPVAPALGTGTAPYTATFSPAASLAKLRSEDPNGIWKLLVTDTVTANTGVIDTWGLSLLTQPTGTVSAISPRIVVSQGDGATGKVAAGQIEVVWNDNGTIYSDPILVGTPPPQYVTFVDPAAVKLPLVEATHTAGTPTPPDSPGVLTETLPIALPVGFTATDFQVTVALAHPDLRQLQIQLVPPNGLAPINLLLNDVDGSDAAINPAQGFTTLQANIGEQGNSTPGAVFDEHSTTVITQGAAPRIGHFRAEDATNLLSEVNGLTAAQLNGPWKLVITDYFIGTGAKTTGTLDNFTLQFTQATPLPLYTVAAAAAVGAFPISPTGSISLAADNTVGNAAGASSTNGGALYVAYSGAGNTSISVARSADGGKTWTTTQVSDNNSFADGFSDTGRPQYDPEIAVDQKTGTIAVQYYDARYDALGTRVATTLSTSGDGGATFSAQYDTQTGKPSALNKPLGIIDAITGNAVNGTFLSDPHGNVASFGEHQGLVIYGGHVVSLFAGNTGGAGIDIESATATVAAGPRIAAGSMGLVAPSTFFSNGGVTPYNGIASGIPGVADGTPFLDGFVVTFDRLVDSNSLTAADVAIYFRTPGKLGTLAADEVVTSVANGNGDQILSVTPATPGTTTSFLVTLTPMARVGTYSYVVSPNAVSDDVGSTYGVANGLANAGNNMDQNADGVTGSLPANTVGDRFAMPTPNGTLAYAANTGAQPTFNSLTLPLMISGPYVVSTTASNLTDTFTSNAPIPIPDNSPAGVASTIKVPLSGRALVNLSVTINIAHANLADLSVSLISAAGTIIPLVLTGDATGANFTNATFVSTNPQSALLSTGTAPYTGTFESSGSLAALAGQDPGFNGGTWQLVVADNAAGTTGSILGWSLGLTTQTTGADNAVVDGKASSINVTFDRAMDPASLTAASIVRMIGPAGAISGPFSITPVGSSLRTFRVGFPAQTVSGTYSIVLASTVKSAAGDALDTNRNAGLDNLRGTQSSGTTSVVTSVTTKTTIPAGTLQAPTQTDIPILVPQNFIVQGATFQLDITFPSDKDLTARLISPDGSVTITLFSGVGNNGTRANFSNTLFTVTATTPIQNGTAPFASSYLLQSAGVSDFATLVNNGILSSPNGLPWILRITNAGTSTGTVNSATLSLDKAIPVSGLGEPVADQKELSLRVFNVDPLNPASQQAWTELGPTQINNGNISGRVSAIAVDPSDPSGNTVYIGAASGGIWKTTNFLDPSGPTYIPLTDFGPNLALTIGSIAVYNTTGDASKSVIIAGTGDSSTGTAGVGFLMSSDGGATWTVLNSLDNSKPLAQRANNFGGTTTYKIAIDPNLTASGKLVIYAALGDVSGKNKGGLYKSVDSGQTWTALMVGQGDATDVVLDQNSDYRDISNPTGNLEYLYTGIKGKGVYFSSNQGQAFTLLSGGPNDALIQDNGVPVPVGAGATANLNPSGAVGRILLAKPALLDRTQVTRNKLYQGWLYAMVLTPGGDLSGLYMTKDFGQTWTQIHFRAAIAGGFITAITNDATQPDVDVFAGRGNYDAIMSVDPSNPAVVYLGGTASFIIRVDTTTMADSHSFFVSNDRNSAGSPLTLDGTIGGLNNPTATPYTNLILDPLNPYAANSTVVVNGVDTTAGKGLSNDGSGTKWVAFPFFGVTLNGRTNLNAMLTITDPLTGKTRMILGDDLGVFSFLDDGTGKQLSSLGTQSFVNGSFNGNLQIAQLFNGAIQPTTSLGTSLIYLTSTINGYQQSTSDILTTGDTSYSATGGDGMGPELSGAGVAVDETGAKVGTVYRFEWPSDKVNGTPVNTNFFVINGVAQDFGLVQNTTGGNAALDAQWPDRQGANFAVNPINPSQIVIASQPNGANTAQIFATANEGGFWSVIGGQKDFAGLTTAATFTSLTYGAPDPKGPGGPAVTNFFMYAGTSDGRVYVTFKGGGHDALGNSNWLALGGGSIDGTPIESIVPNPLRGSHELYVVTQKNVYYMADSSAGGAWINLTAAAKSNLSKLTRNAFGDANLNTTAVGSLSALVADWRYAIPNSLTALNGATHPVLYLAADGGVFRSVDQGVTWMPFPDAADDGAARDGGNLPAVQITGLSLSLGKIDPTTGFAQLQKGDADLLMATTNGRGVFGISLAPFIVANSLHLSTVPYGSPNFTNGLTNNATPFIDGYSAFSSQSTSTGGHIRVTLFDANGNIIGGYNPGDASGPNGSNATDIPANWTAADGSFHVQVTTPLVGTNPTVKVQMTDNAGAAGPIGSLSFTLDTTPPAIVPATIHPQEAVPFSGKMASFTDAHLDPLTGGPVTIDWGDGTPQDSTVGVPDGAGGFDIFGSHTYVSEGDDNIALTVTDVAGNIAQVTATVTVDDVAVNVTAAGTKFGGKEHTNSLIQTVATFTDPSGAEIPVVSTATDPVAAQTGGVPLVDATPNSPGGPGGPGAPDVASTPGVLAEPLTVNLAKGFKVSDIAVTVAISHPDVRQLRVQLFSPNNVVAPIDLVLNSVDDTGTPISGQGITAGPFADIGELQGIIVGTSFGEHSLESIDAAGASRLGTFKVDDSTNQLSQFNGLTDAELNGQWTLVVTDYFNDGNPVTGTLDEFQISFTNSNYSASIDWGDGSPVDTTTPQISFSGGVFTVTGAHQYAEDGAYNVVTSVNHGGLSADDSSAPASAVIQAVAVNAAATEFAATEGASGTFNLATFTDPDNSDGSDVNDVYSVDIDWGDGSAHSAGTATFDAANNQFVVTGAHTYAIAGSYSPAVTINSGVSPATQSAVMVSPTATVADVALSITGATGLLAREGLSTGTITVATFTDGGGALAPSHYQPTMIDWGDGTAPTLATLRFDNVTQVFSVRGSHTYAEEGTYNITATVKHDILTPDTTTTATITVSDPSVVSSPVSPVSSLATQNPGPVLVAAFIDPGGAEDPLADYTASIDWGDGTTADIGTIGAPAGPAHIFPVTGSHIYAIEGNYVIHTTITHDAAAAPTVIATNVTVAELPLVLVASSTPLEAAEGTSSSLQTVATFTDPLGPEATSAYSASINWGDGSTTANALITFDINSNTFGIVGSHLYVAEGNKTIVTTLRHNLLPANSVTGSAVVAELSVSVTAATATLHAVEQSTSGTLVVATFTDPAGFEANNGANYLASINWGDGSSASTGTIAFNAGTGVFSVSGSHKYLEDGNFSAVTSVTHLGTTATASSLVVVADVPLSATGGASIIATEGTLTAAHTVATFTDPAGAEANDGIHYTAVIDWGDGSTSGGTILLDPNTGIFSVQGSHRYSIDNPQPIVATIHHGTAADISVSSTATVTDVPVVARGFFTLVALEGTTSPVQTIATFIDPGGDGVQPIANYSASIDWGDGTPATNGFIHFDGEAGLYAVGGGHNYAVAGHYTIVTTIGHEQTTVQTATSGANVQDVPLLPTGSFTFNAVEGAASAVQTVATFTDPGGAELLAHYSATINWGDGTTSDGVISFNDVSQVFTVSRAHTYVEEGAYNITTTIQHDSAPNAIVNSTAFVADPAVTLSTATSIAGVEGESTGLITLGTFTDPGGAEAAGRYTATIDWGDGSPILNSGVTLNASTGAFSIVSSHTYTESGQFTITTSVAHGSASPSVSTTQASVTDAALEVTAVPISVNEGATFSGEVALLRDANSFAPTGDYTATITWGDGSTSPGAILADPTTSGLFRVIGTHFFSNGPAVFFDGVSITDKDAPQSPSSSTSTITVANTPPAPIITGPAQRFAGVTSFTISATDASASDTAAGFEYTLDFGDGSAPLVIPRVAGNGAAQTITHSFPTNDASNVTLIATDIDGASGAATLVSQSALPAGADTPTSTGLTVNDGSTNASTVATLAFQASTPSNSVHSLSMSDVTLLRSGNIVVPMNSALLNFNPVSGKASLNLAGVNLADGNYQLQIRMGASGVLPLNFHKLRGDVDGDGVVTSRDVSAVKNHIGRSGAAFDVNGDGRVTPADMNLVKAAVGHRTAPIAKPVTLQSGRTISAPRLDFGKVKLGASVAPIDVVIRNPASNPGLLLQDLRINNNPGVLDFEIVGAAWGQKASQYAINSGQSIVVRIFLNPSVSGNVNAALHFVFSQGTRSLLTAANLPITAKIA